MDKVSRFDGPNWRDDPRENTPPVLKDVGFLESRRHRNPELFSLKMQIVGKIRNDIETKKWSQRQVVNHLNDIMVEKLDQPDVSRILNGNVTRYSIERLATVLAALGNRVTLKSVPMEGKGCFVMEDA